MRLLLDVHFSPQVAEQLRAQGVDAVAVAAVAGLRQADDGELLRWASAERRVLVTENVGDLSLLHGSRLSTGEGHAGIVFTSPQRLPRRRRGIGVLVRALAALVAAAPDLGSDVHWLGAVGDG